MKNQTNQTQKEISAYYIEQVSDNGETYFQIVLRRNGKILYSDISLSKVAYKLFAYTTCIPTYKDGSKVVLNTNKNENALIQIVNQYLIELSKEYDTLQKEMAAMEMKGQFNYSLYMEMLSYKTELELAQQKRDSIISI